MALKATYLAFSDKPKDFSAFMNGHGKEFAPGVFIITGDHAREVVVELAKAAGVTAYMIETSLIDIEVYK
ncbi:hypothetical protein [Lysobacter enzymogenes]|uniref:hypothetical protein n=1 Tax=Lysobacter enzymogenes TaxID=69 RepID=UPI001AF53BCB|nr:hypothetical protein [Lysobacter enzymogenes]QQQ03362.1 hypothetical protein JHW41_10615 [Lysobacter enzymogenes]